MLTMSPQVIGSGHRFLVCIALKAHWFTVQTGPLSLAMKALQLQSLEMAPREYKFYPRCNRVG